jgi:hypothetical protein
VLALYLPSQRNEFVYGRQRTPYGLAGRHAGEVLIDDLAHHLRHTPPGFLRPLFQP